MQNIEINFGVRPCIVKQNGEEKHYSICEIISQSLLQQMCMLAVVRGDKLA